MKWKFLIQLSIYNFIENNIKKFNSTNSINLVYRKVMLKLLQLISLLNSINF